jgi:predicted DNA-binding protein
MASERLVIKKMGGENGYKNFSVRIKSETVEQLDELSKKTNRSRNELINLILDYGIENCDIE